MVSVGPAPRAEEQSCGLSPCGPQSYRSRCGSDPSYKPGEVRYSTCLSNYRACFVEGRWYCIPPSPEDLAAEAERKRRAELRTQLIETEVRRLGEHRRGEAIRLVDMRLAADVARPKPKPQGSPTAAASGSGASSPPTPPTPLAAAASTPKPKAAAPEMVDCSRPAKTRWEHWPYLDMETINRLYAEYTPQKWCGSGGGTRGPLECHRQWVFAGTKMGNCGAKMFCNAEKRSCPAGSKVSRQ